MYKTQKGEKGVGYEGNERKLEEPLDLEIEGGRNEMRIADATQALATCM